MKQVIAIVVVMLLMTPLALASDTARGGYATPSGAATEWLNTNPDFYHAHNYAQTSSYKAPMGAGVDLTLYEFDVAGVGLGIGVDTEYDINNGVFGVMGKVRVNTTGLINTLRGK